VTMDSDERFVVGSILAGKLRIVRPLGAGGMGAVYEVEHELTRHRRALKLLHSQMAQIPSVVERFLREASAAGRIGNPHIVETFDAGRLETGEPYIVMELLKGKTLAELLEENGPLSLDRACEVVIQACDAVSAAHAAGIVHRDLKPENLFLQGADLSFVKILDFGVSKFDSATTGVDGLTMEGSPIGTPYYMSPEQVRGEKSIDARADVYALGVLFYECLTGAKPFVAETLPHLAVLIHQGEYEAPSHLRQGLPPAADLVISRAMASDRSKRYASMTELSAAVARLRAEVGPIALHQTQPLTRPPPGLAPIAGPAATAESAGQGAQPLPRPAAALTPGVFTSPSPSEPRPAPAPKLRLLAVAGGLAAVALLAGLALRKPAAEPPLPEPSVQAVPVSPPASLPATAPAASPATVVLELPSAAPAPVAPASASARPGAAPRTQPAANAPRSRASSYGLSEDNPFK
jgi:serine/threonine protein kinase